MVSGLPALPSADDPAVADADVGLDDAPVVEDHGAGDDGVGRALGAGGPGLAHRLADHLAAAEDRLVAGAAGPPQRSSSTSMSRSVSASRIRSPVVGP